MRASIDQDECADPWTVIRSVYTDAFSGGRDAPQGIGNWMTFYNHRRPHATHGGETPAGVYRERPSAPGPALHPTALVA